MKRRIEGTVYWIENGKPTSRVVDAEEAFSNPDQAAAQVMYAEKSGNREAMKLTRLAFRQFQGRRYRGANKPKPASQRTRRRSHPKRK